MGLRVITNKLKMDRVLVNLMSKPAQVIPAYLNKWIVAGWLCLISGASMAAEFAWNQASEQARLLAAEPYRESAEVVPDWLRQLTFEQWSDIRFHSKSAIWRGEGLGYEIWLHHLGSIYNSPVKVSLIESGGQLNQVPFSPDQFYYGTLVNRQAMPNNMGYAGLSLHHDFDKESGGQRFVEFLGASFFRAVGEGGAFGVNARGLAINVGLPEGEEFPFFREFWIRKPAQPKDDLVIYALLDSPSLSAAYQFTVKAGKNTTMDVRARLFFRKPVKKLGIGPMSGMYYYGENSPKPASDLRPEVHNVDGLLIASASKAQLWRPAQNRLNLVSQRFDVDGLVGFGLMQRDQRFDHYQDMSSAFEVNPSVWLVPDKPWKGHVELIEIPVKNDLNRNVIAFWVPKNMPKFTNPMDFSYRLLWTRDEPRLAELGRVVATRVATNEQKRVVFEVDYEGKALTALTQEITPIVRLTGKGRVIDPHVRDNPETGGKRLRFMVKPEGDEQVELEVILQRGEKPIAETWRYLWQPSSPG